MFIAMQLEYYLLGDPHQAKCGDLWWPPQFSAAYLPRQELTSGRGARGRQRWVRTTTSSWSLLKTIIIIFVAQGTGKCIDYEYAGFHCVPIYQCNNDGVIRTAAQGLFDPRYSVLVLNMLAIVLHSWYKRCKSMYSLQEHLWGWSVRRILRRLPRRLLSSRWGKRPLHSFSFCSSHCL